MNDTLTKAINAFLERATAVNRSGRTLTAEELADLQDKLGTPLPDWLTNMLATFPISGIEFQWKAFDGDDSFDGLCTARWPLPQDWIDQSLNRNPGKDLLKQNHLCIAIDEDGTDDPYFIKLDQSDNPAVHLIYHEPIDDADTRIEPFDADHVAPTLSDFFDKTFFDAAYQQPTQPFPAIKP